MKNICRLALLVFFCFHFNLSFAQNAFYESQYLATLDSTELKEMFHPGDDLKKQLLYFNQTEKDEIENLILFLKQPFNYEVKKMNFNVIQKSIEKYNQYVIDRREYQKELASGPLALSKGFLPIVGASGVALSLIPYLISGNTSLSDTLQTDIIDGLAKYYAVEFKKAQTITYMKVFESTANEIGELQILFPDSFKKLKNADPSKFPDLGNEYKKIFNEDLKNAWPNLIKYVENHPVGIIPDNKLKLLTSKNIKVIKDHDFYFPVLISTEIISRTIENQHPVDILNFIDNKYYDKSLLTNKDIKSKIIASLHGINLIQSNLRDTTKTINERFSNVWIDSEQLKYLNTQNEIKYFFGLIYQQDTKFANYLFHEAKIDTLTINNKINELEILLKKNIDPIVNDLKTIQEAGKSLSKNDDHEILIKYLEANLSLFSSFNLIYKNEKLDKYFETSKSLIHIYGSVKKSDYSNVTYYILSILNDFLGDDVDYQNVVFKIEEYGSFMSEIINAENSDEVKETITKFAAPPSTFILKRTYSQTLSITGQPGYFGSLEKLDGQENWQFVSGITLPMGFEYTITPVKDLKKARGSLGLFVQLIDIGAVLNFRIDNSTSTLPDQITFEQIFSPGISINYGFKNSPITIATGYQRTPELRKITENGNDKFVKGDRWFIRFAWDIPLINIAKRR